MAIKSILGIPLQSDRIKFDKDESDLFRAVEYERGPNGSITYDRNILPNFPKLEERIKRSVKRYAADAMGVDWDIKIMNSWGIKHLQGDMGQPHSHAQSWISGVYYVDVKPDSGDIIFLKENRNFFNLSHCRDTGHNKDYHYHKPVNGDLILFPSYVKHAIDVQSVPNFQRLALAFNVLPNGVVGGNENMDYMYV